MSERRSKRGRQNRGVTLIKVQITVAVLAGLASLVQLANTVLHLM